MQTLARLFGRSPFAPLQTHMAKVASCVQEMIPLFDALTLKDAIQVEKIASKLSKLEHDADLTKNDIRNHLPSGLFLPIARASLLEILALQDSIADKCEDVAMLLTLKEIELRPVFENDFKSFLEKNIETFHGAHQIIQEMGELLETSFGGSEADKVRKMVDKVAFKEHEADLIQRNLLKKVFSESDKMHAAEFYLWMKIIQELAGISNVSENLANRVGMTLEVK